MVPKKERIRVLPLENEYRIQGARDGPLLDVSTATPRTAGPVVCFNRRRSCCLFPSLRPAWQLRLLSAFAFTQVLCRRELPRLPHLPPLVDCGICMAGQVAEVRYVQGSSRRESLAAPDDALCALLRGRATDPARLRRSHRFRVG